MTPEEIYKSFDDAWILMFAFLEENETSNTTTEVFLNDKDLCSLQAGCNVAADYSSFRLSITLEERTLRGMKVNRQPMDGRDKARIVVTVPGGWGLLDFPIGVSETNTGTTKYQPEKVAVFEFGEERQ